ncbi:MAG: M23 family metallopeptidase [Shewanella sp.]|nr:M23 family metallopeptidase [Shewanella sp.]MCF1431042.1 M23 family metallopeptidase [Shewanella sp.]MCF1437907.1 M23 family metallopeptidase [Shewanella sp.]MCF1457999.1 M23 family metallopeptidase [Shewanella sp.]
MKVKWLLLELVALSCLTLLQVQQVQAADIQLQGVLRQGALIRASVPVGSQVTLDGKPVKVSAAGKLAFGFDRNAPAKQTLKVTLPDGGVVTRELTVAPQQYRIQQVKGIAKKIMQPKPKDVARAKQDSAQVSAARATDSARQDFSQDFIWPLIGRISGVYGSQRVYNGEPGRPHFGVDVAAPTGTRVVAPADGVITLAVPDMFYSGGTMIIDHGHGVSSSFLHLSKLLVPVGTEVKQGQEVAEVGSTGRSTGPHLDWRINWYQMRLDPTSVVPSMRSLLADTPARP